jgi:predicted DNA-binding transcriptional regulator AlpA
MNKPVHQLGLWPDESAADVLLCRKDVIRLLGISSTQFWRLRRYHGFPQGIRLSPGIERWRLSDVRADIERRAREGGGQQPG